MASPDNKRLIAQMVARGKLIAPDMSISSPDSSNFPVVRCGYVSKITPGYLILTLVVWFVFTAARPGWSWA